MKKQENLNEVIAELFCNNKIKKKDNRSIIIDEGNGVKRIIKSKNSKLPKFDTRPVTLKPGIYTE